MRIRILFVVVVVATTVLQVAEAAKFNVGGETIWRIPSDHNFYSFWTTRQTFALHDVLVFRFASDSHSVAGVTKEAYENCDINNPKFVNHTTPFRFSLDKVEDYYFICTVAHHCAAGQKLAITSIKQPSSAVTPPPPPNSASSLASIFTVSFISIAVALIIVSP